MKEIVLTMYAKEWAQIKSGKQSIVLRNSKPEAMFFPFRVIVYLRNKNGVVGAFDCDQIIETIRPQKFAEGSCQTEEEILSLANGKSLCGWYIKAGSVAEYEVPFPLEMATGLKYPPQTWRYIEGAE